MSKTDNKMREILARIPDALEVVGTFVEGEARTRATVLTGNLRGSITHSTRKGGVSKVKEPAKQEDAVSQPDDDDTVRIGTAVEYAPFIEFGTSKQSAQPFLRPAVLENKDRITSLFKKAMKR